MMTLLATFDPFTLPLLCLHPYAKYDKSLYLRVFCRIISETNR